MRFWISVIHLYLHLTPFSLVLREIFVQLFRVELFRSMRVFVDMIVDMAICAFPEREPARLDSAEYRAKHSAKHSASLERANALRCECFLLLRA